MASQAFSTAEQVLAVVFEPPATGAGGSIAVADLDRDGGERHAEPLRGQSAPITV